MIVSTLFDQINSAYRGSDDEVPAAGTPDSDLWYLTANRKISEWANDTKQSWRSLFSYAAPNEPGTVATTATTTLTGTSTNFLDYRVGDKVTVSGETIRTIATITSNTVLTVTVAFSNTAYAKTFTHDSIIATSVQSYNLHRRFLHPSDENFTVTSTQDITHTISMPQERSRFANSVYIHSLNPRILTFYDDILSTSQIVAGTLRVPGFYAPADLTALTDTVPVDDPYWLVYAVASELAYNDLTYSDKAPDLNQKANNLYSLMGQNNRRGTTNNPRIANTNVNRITGNF